MADVTLSTKIDNFLTETSQFATGLTASATQTQAGGLALTNVTNDITTVANPNDAVTLPTAAVNDVVKIYNNGANVLQVFPAASDNLGNGVDASTTIDPGEFGIFTAKDATNWITVINIPPYGQLGIVIDGGGSAITTGIKGDLRVPYDCTITSADVVLDQSGSIVVDIWKDTYANYPPTDADSITASAPPTVSSAEKSQDTTLTGWTTSLTKGDYLRFNVDSITTATRATVSIAVTKN